MKAGFRKGGIHPPQCKTASRDIELLPLPRTATVLLSQHIGRPAEPIVTRGQHVARGEMIARNPALVSASLHAPISGTVTAVDTVEGANGKPAPAIVIKADDSDHEADTTAREKYWRELVPGVTDRDLDTSLSADEIRSRISRAGIVGLGGALFPSHVKLAVKDGQTPEVLIINGCECEPYLMCDDALMCRYPARIMEGVELMMKASGAPRAVVAVEDNKPEAIAALTAALDPAYAIEVMPLRTKYPQGGEKQLVEAVTGRRIASGALPLSVGAIVNNVATAFAVWQAVATDMPLIERTVTVTGDIPEAERRNWLAAVGTPVSELPFTAPEAARVLSGGPMMGRAMVCLDAPVTKGTSGVTVLAAVPRPKVQACLRCGACVDVCPMGLEPYLLAAYGRLRRWDDAREALAADCIECGSCSYTCPSGRPLLDYIRIAKQFSK